MCSYTSTPPYVCLAFTSVTLTSENMGKCQFPKTLKSGALVTRVLGKVELRWMHLTYEVLIAKNINTAIFWDVT